MESASVVAAGCLALLCLLLTALLVRGRAVARREAETARAETAEMRLRIDALSERLEEASAAMSRAGTTGEAAYVITDAGRSGLEPTVADSVVLSATLGEPLVKVVALGHGVRRALSAESRNRIWFEVRREVRASRRRRRRETKAFVREARAARRESVRESAPEPGQASPEAAA